MAPMRKHLLAGAGRLGRHVPIQAVQVFSFVASPRVREAPWDVYSRFHRRTDGVIVGPYGVVLVASHARATEALRDRRLSVREELATRLPQSDRESGPFEALMAKTLLFVDPPDHTRLRRLVSTAFTPRRVARLRARTETIVGEYLSELRPRRTADLIAELALPMPVHVICELLGVQHRDRPGLVAMARDLAPRLDVSLFRDEAKERAGDEAAEGLVAFFAGLLDDPSRRVRDGLLDALAEVDGLERDEVTALCVLLLAAGFETTTNLIGNGVHALLQHPDQLERLRDGHVDPAAAVEELLRFDPPVQFTQRAAVADIDVGAHRVPAGSLIAVLLGAANRDPDVFADPNRLDLGRDPNPHLSFSSGIHHCLGAALARLEAEVAIPAILRELPDLRLAGKPRWRDTFVLKGMTELPVAWG